MKIKQLKMHNWIPFQGRTTLDFSTDDKKKFTFVRGGRNRSGKTALNRAIRWALYGNTGDTNKYKKKLDLLNKLARKEGVFEFSVELSIEEDKKNITVVNRSCKPKIGIKRPKNDGEFEQSFTVTRNGTTLTPDESKDRIKMLLDERISRFFLFDGEMLDEYEDLIEEPTAQSSKRIKENIEQVIGKPMLVNAKNDLGVLCGKIVTALQRTATSAEKEAFYEQYNKAIGAEDSKEKELTGLNELKEETETNRKQTFKEIQDKTDQIEASNRITAIKETLDPLNTKIKGHSEFIRGNIDVAVQAILKIALQQPRHAMQERRTKLETEQNAIDINKFNIEALSKSIQKEKCDTCGSSIAKDELARIQKKLDKLNSQNNSAVDQGELREIKRNLERIDMLGKNPATVEILQKLKFETKALNLAISTNDNLAIEKENLENQLRTGGSKSKELQELQKKDGRLIESIGGLKTKIEIASKELEVLSADVVLFGKQEPKFADDDDPLQKKKKIYNSLKNVFQKSIDQLLEEVKKEIETKANQLHRKMDDFGTKNTLEIDNSFGLRLRDEDGELITDSAGGSQLVALALIGGLKHATKLEGPLFLDTPFGRIDPYNRKKTLKYLPKMGTQVVLFVHEGEIKKGDDNEQAIVSQIGKDYTITKKSDRLSTLTPTNE